jgi:hypothetical protein
MPCGSVVFAMKIQQRVVCGAPTIEHIMQAGAEQVLGHGQAYLLRLF